MTESAQEQVHPVPNNDEQIEWHQLVDEVGKARDGVSNDTEIQALYEAVCYAAQVARLPLPEWF